MENDIITTRLNFEEHSRMESKGNNFEEKIFEAEVVRRIALRDAQTNPISYSVEEVMGEGLANMEFDPDAEDG